MKLFLSAVEHAPDKIKGLQKVIDDRPLLWNLMSYYYISISNTEDWARLIRDRSRLVMVDSGAHSFQKGKKVNWREYTKEYAEFINRFDAPNVIGYFEMDVDNIIGYEEVLALREILKSECEHPEKIIPVWHKNRGIRDFKTMCDECAGGVVAITGFKNEDIKDEQYPMFVKEAWRRGCKIHCLGMTRKEVLEKVPFDFVDSSSWAIQAIHGRVGNQKVSKEFSRTNRADVLAASYIKAMDSQIRYWRKWRNVCGDEF